MALPRGLAIYDPVDVEEEYFHAAPYLAYYRLWPSGKPRCKAFWRNAATVRFISFDIFATEVLAREWPLISLMSSLVHSRRLERFAFCAMMMPPRDWGSVTQTAPRYKRSTTLYFSLLLDLGLSFANFIE